MATLVIPPTQPVSGLTATASGLALTASDPHVQPELFSITICYPLPTAADWLITDATLSAGDDTAQLSASAPIQEFTEPVAAGMEVCRTHSFELSLPPSPFMFAVAVQRLETSNPIVEPDCPGAQGALDRLDTAVILFCEETLGYPSFEISHNPKGIPLDEVQRIVHDAFYGVVSGPWVLRGISSP
ncbi:MAG: hypothetical protein A2Y63_00135 [Candidatus Riflebacteria bacterium RBG_13_59_9]|nr:MAG: hypothetical protein A2Y63_00135 [Candidatus Riflebacteria bacterium RBG_13_59_9]